MLNSTFLKSVKKLRSVILLALFFTMGACAQTTLEEQFRGIESCSIKNIFLDPVSRKPSGEYFSARKLEPCRIDEVAFYCVSDTFYGLHVNQVAIPYVGPFSVHAIYLKESPDVVEPVLRAQFKGIKLNQNDGASPILIADPKQPGSSVFYCDEYSE
ncbi:hypothetical protein F0169_22890 [Pseudomonas sp. MAFF 212408]|uniref:Lipoprotein n=1 Tax=Pseudomonas kitaguniensis TaxID=2607908 RepID=A0A5N7KR53_9PSED|nr:hypothetical protein [Pseudomonas kitaguniensis]MPR04666.1 hypothetical protein [Pseudomonas kitaguniensis]